MKKKPEPKKKVNKQDATLKNINALKKRVTELESWVKVFRVHLIDMNDRLLELQPVHTVLCDKNYKVTEKGKVKR